MDYAIFIVFNLVVATASVYLFLKYKHFRIFAIAVAITFTTVFVSSESPITSDSPLCTSDVTSMPSRYSNTARGFPLHYIDISDCNLRTEPTAYDSRPINFALNVIFFAALLEVARRAKASRASSLADRQ